MQKKCYGEPSLGARLKTLDFRFFALCAALCAFGIFWVASATRYLGSIKPVLVQSIAALLGLLLMLPLGVLNFEKYRKKLTIALFFASVALLLLTLVIGRGDGNRNWIDIPLVGISVQPSEFVKLGFICTVSAHCAFLGEKLNHPLSVLTLLCHAGLLIGLVVLQGDLGSALVFLFVFFCMLLAAGLSLWYFLGAAVLLGAVTPFLWSMLSDYQRRRILVGFHPESDPRGYGYQVLCSKNAIANGGLTGQGYLHGTISQSAAESALPARHTDMIFAVVGEEGGFLSALLYLMLLSLLVLLIYRAARRAKGKREMLICVGAGAVLVFQSLENIGMCLGLLPVVGITLPFLSYGGSSMLSLLLLMGIVFGLAKNDGTRRRRFESGR